MKNSKHDTRVDDEPTQQELPPALDFGGPLGRALAGNYHQRPAGWGPPASQIPPGTMTSTDPFKFPKLPKNSLF